MYKIVKMSLEITYGNPYDLLEKQVSSLMSEGWSLVGGLICYQDMLMQSMYK